MRAPASLPLLLGLSLLSCKSTPQSEPEPQDSAGPQPVKAPESSESKTPAKNPAEKPVKSGEKETRESDHHVVYADRSSMGYLLLLPASDAGPAPSREELVGLVERTYIRAQGRAAEEVKLLQALIEREPHETPESSFAQSSPELPTPEELEAYEQHDLPDLLGFHIESMSMGVGAEALVAAEVLSDPVLTRELDEAARGSLGARRRALLLRADYRNRHGARGLRLLQALVHLVAGERSALIHDPDTLETMGPERFFERRLQTQLGNLADQIAVVPFVEDEAGGGEASVRLQTRGMRRFGAVDLELAGLPAHGPLLERATRLLNGLALAVARDAGVHGSGFAYEVPDPLPLRWEDVRRAYGTRGEALGPGCEGCPQRTDLHLVERRPHPLDPQGHVVAQVVAPRERSEAADYDHVAWIQESLNALMGPEGP